MPIFTGLQGTPSPKTSPGTTVGTEHGCLFSVLPQSTGSAQAAGNQKVLGAWRAPVRVAQSPSVTLAAERAVGRATSLSPARCASPAPRPPRPPVKRDKSLDPMGPLGIRTPCLSRFQMTLVRDQGWECCVSPPWLPSGIHPGPQHQCPDTTEMPGLLGVPSPASLLQLLERVVPSGVTPSLCNDSFGLSPAPLNESSVQAGTQPGVFTTRLKCQEAPGTREGTNGRGGWQRNR